MAPALVLATLAASTGAMAEIGAVAGRPGGVYVSVEGSYQAQNGPDVAAFGDVAATPGAGNGFAATGTFATNGLVVTRGITSVPGSEQDVTAISSGANASINAALSSGTPPNVATANAQAAANLEGFTSALVDVLANGASARANAEGGRFISAGSSFAGALTIGYFLPMPLTGTFERVEVYGGYTRNTERDGVKGAAAGISVDGTTAFAVAASGNGAAFGITPVSVAARQETSFGEIGLRLKSRRMAAPVPLFLSVEGFYARYDQSTAMRADTGGLISSQLAPQLIRRNADTDGDLFGTQLALETSIPVSGTALELIGRAAGGIYHLAAEGRFSDNFGNDTHIRDRQSTVGLRFGGEAGVRIALGQATSFTLSGGIDHFTDVPRAVLPRFAGDGPARVGTDDLTTYRATGRLTIMLDGLGR